MVSVAGKPMNRIKAIVVSLFAAYWAVVIAILFVARDTYDQGLGVRGNQRLAEIGALLVLTALLALLSTGVVRSWRWTFWLILIAFLANGVLRAPLAALQLAGIAPSQGPGWFTWLQLVVALVQFLIGLAMLAGYRRAGIWGGL